MASSYPRFVLLLLLVLLACFTPQRVAGQTWEGDPAFQIMSAATEKVPAADQVSANQLFSKTWQVKKSAVTGGQTTVETVETMLPGRVFISYVEDASSELLAEVVVSGSSEALLKHVDVFGSRTEGSITVTTLGTSTSLVENSYLLTEIKLHQKRTVKRIDPSGTADVVVLDNVLYSQSKEDFKAVSSVAPSVTSDFELTEVAPSEGSRRWNITGSDKNININLDLGIPGAAEVRTISGDLSPDIIAVVTLSEEIAFGGSSYSKIPVDKVEIAASHGSNGTEELQFRVKSSFNAKDKKLKIVATIDVIPSARVSVVSSVVERLEDFRYNESSEGVTVTFLLQDNGTVFISDKEAKLFLDGADFSGIDGNLQVDVGEISTSSLTVALSSAGKLNFFADTISSSAPISASVFSKANICLSSSNNLKVSQLDATKSSQLSYTGKAGARKCVKRDLPERVPGKTTKSLYDSSSSLPYDSDITASTPTPSKMVKSAASALRAGCAMALSVVALTAAILL